MKSLWAPWRIKYLTAKKQAKCIFCQKPRSKKRDYIVFKTRYSVCRMNIFPYNNGHLMISPVKHVREISALNDTEILDLIKALNKAKKLLAKVLKPHGYNIGMNISKSAGAGIAGHLHIHIVPRWRGDTNFMPVLADTKIISQSLGELYGLLKKSDKPEAD